MGPPSQRSTPSRPTRRKSSDTSTGTYARPRSASTPIARTVTFRPPLGDAGWITISLWSGIPPACARTAVHAQCRVVGAVEPTGRLDSETGRSIMELLRAVVRSESVTILVATDDPSLIELADRVVELRDGHIITPEPGH